MRGTSDEILEWLTHHPEYGPLMNMSRQRLVGLRYRLKKGTVGERTKEEMLERLEKRIESLRSITMSSSYDEHRIIRKVRDAYILPAIVRDHHGKMYSETGMIRMVAQEVKMQDLHLDKVCAMMKCGAFPSKAIVREVLNRKGWSIFEERMVLPSVWEVE